MWIGVDDVYRDGLINRKLTINTDHIVAVSEPMDDNLVITIFMQSGISFDITKECFDKKIKPIIEEKLKMEENLTCKE